MTPDELKNYVDAAMKQRDSFTLAYFIVVPLISIFGSFLSTYFQEKGKNAATKEDVGRITTEIEASKAHFTERLEHLRVELSSRAHYGKVRYEREMKVFEEVWPKLCVLREAVLSLRPVMDCLKEGETKESRKKERAERFSDAAMALAKTVDHSRPFYPPSIWKELRTLLDLSWGEAFDFRFSDDMGRGRGDYWDKAMSNSKAINEQVDKTCEAIRSRLTAFDEA
jgi:hypothetical protein